MAGVAPQALLPEWIFSGYKTATDTAIFTGSGSVRAVWIAAAAAASSVILDDSTTNLIKIAVPAEESRLWILPTPVVFGTDLGATLAGAAAVYGVWYS